MSDEEEYNDYPTDLSYGTNDPEHIPGDPKNWRWDEKNQEWDFADDEVLDPEVEKTLDNLREISRGVLEKIVSDRTYEPSLDEAKVVMSLLALESATEGSWNAPLNACKPVTDFINFEMDLEDIRSKTPENTPLSSISGYVFAVINLSGLPSILHSKR